jgi:TP901 family phage tail tape measure protein/lambda family phage tail tape measure protein
VADFFIRVKVDPTQAVAANRVVQGSLATTEARAKTLQATLVKTFAIFGAAVGVGAGIKLLADFSQEMSTVQAITGATAFEFEQLEETAKQLGATTRFTASEAAQGMVLLSRAGFNAAETMETVDDTLKLAQAGALDLASAADITAKTIRGFRLDTDQASRVVDVLALAANTSNTNVQQLGEAIKFVAPVSAGLRVSLEETVAAVMALSDAGLQASLAGTGLRRVMAELESVGGPAAKILKDLGIEEENVEVSTVGLVVALQQMEKAGIDTGKALEVFGQRGGPAFEVLKSNIPHIQDAIKHLKAAGGTADEIARIMDDNLNGALLRTKSAFESVVLEMGKLGAQENLKQFFEGLAGALRKLSENLEATIDLVKALGVTMAITFGPQIFGKATILIVNMSKGLLKLSVGMAAMSTGSTVALRASVLRLAAAFRNLWGVIMTNPLIAFGAVAIGGTIALMDKLNREMDEAERMQDAAHAKALQMIRARLAEVKALKAQKEEQEKQTKAVAGFITKLKEENRLLRMTEEAREIEVALMDAADQAGRKLLSGEIKRVTELVKERQAIEKNNEFMEERKELLKSIIGPAQDLIRFEEHLNALVKEGEITQAQAIAKLQELKEQYKGIEEIALELPSYEKSNADLEEQINLLRMSNTEREREAQLLEIDKSIKEGLSPTERESLDLQLQKVQALQTFNDLVQDSVTPQMQLLEMEKQLTLARDEGLISIQQYTAAMERLKLISLDFATDTASGVTRGLQKIQDDILDLASVSEGALVNAWQGAEQALTDFVTTGEADFKGLIDSILADLTRLLLRKALLSLIPGIGPAAGAAPIPGFQHGGSFKVGGSGGPDSQLVAFKATPGEQVTVGHGAAPNVNVPAPELNVRQVNVFDPKAAVDAMDTREGEKLFLNFVRRNPGQIKRALGGG